MFPNATVSSRSSSSHSGRNSCSRNSSMPSLRIRSPLSPKTSYNPLFRHSDAFTSFDASNFQFYDVQREQTKKESRRNCILKRYHSHESSASTDNKEKQQKKRSNSTTRTNYESQRNSSFEKAPAKLKSSQLLNSTSKHTSSTRHEVSLEPSNRHSAGFTNGITNSNTFESITSTSTGTTANYFEDSSSSLQNALNLSWGRHQDAFALSKNAESGFFLQSKRSGDFSTPECSPQSTGERKVAEFEARDFLERYSLPRVVRVANGEPLLLYRCFDNFAKIEAKAVSVKKTKEKTNAGVLYFPEGYNGWFSLTNEKGERSAVSHSSILQLVREQVCSFINIQAFTAYSGQNIDHTDFPGKIQYLKTSVRAGQLFQLRAVFQHRPDSHGSSTKASKISTRNTRDKDLANRYAQLISQNNQELYVPLTTKGEFYEVHSSIKARLCFPGLLDKTGPLALDKDCLYKITHLLRRVALPIKVKLMAGPLPSNLPKDHTDTFMLERKFTEPLMVTCTLPSPNQATKHEISCISLNSNVKLSKCMLGFDSENRLFKSQRLQAALSFCHKNVENWYREVRVAPNIQITGHSVQINSIQSNKSAENCLNCLESPNGACPGCYIKEDIEQKQIISREVMEKFPKSKKWYQQIKIPGINDSKHANNTSSNGEVIEGVDKVKSIERYKDMSKLIEEKFGKKTHNPVKKSASFMFSTKRPNEAENETTQLSKCQSLDNELCHSNKDHKKTTQNAKENVLQSKRRSSNSNISDSLSYDFQMCILNDETVVSKESHNAITSKNAVIAEKKKNKPDLIPTLTKNSSIITDRLCSEFHVKTKNLQKKSVKLQETENKHHTKSVVMVQVHENKKSHAANVDLDVPYSNVADEIRLVKPAVKKQPDENIYAEICENNCNSCDSTKRCDCGSKKNSKNQSEYCYVKLGSNGDSITSDSDEAIYNTLR